MIRLFTAPLIAFLLLTGGCTNENQSLVQPGPGNENFPRAPLDDANAELAALIISGNLVAPISLYRRIHRDLSHIRSEWCDSVPETAIGVRLPWRASRLKLLFDLPTGDSVIAGTYPAWDSLNAALSFDSSTHLRLDMLNTPMVLVRVYFGGRLHPYRLAEYYGALPGVLHSYPSFRYGDWSSLYPHKVDNEMRYFFRKAWGDCPAGCIHSDVHYFRSRNEQICYEGAMLHSHDPEELPSWRQDYIDARTAFFDDY